MNCEHPATDPAASRTNADWVASLSAPGPAREAALAALRRFLLHGLRRSFASSLPVDLHLEDFVQEALLRITTGIHKFRGDSRFETWAMSIAVRIAIAELRRVRWRDVSLDQMIEAGRLFPQAPPGAAPSGELIVVMGHAIRDGLTPWQRDAILAELGGAPPDEIARRLGTNRNALYKLIYDARVRLKQAILKAGWTEDQVLSVLRGG